MYFGVETRFQLLSSPLLNTSFRFLSLAQGSSQVKSSQGNQPSGQPTAFFSQSKIHSGPPGWLLHGCPACPEASLKKKTGLLNFYSIYSIAKALVIWNFFPFRFWDAFFVTPGADARLKGSVQCKFPRSIKQALHFEVQVVPCRFLVHFALENAPPATVPLYYAAVEKIAVVPLGLTPEATYTELRAPFLQLLESISWQLLMFFFCL